MLLHIDFKRLDNNVGDRSARLRRVVVIIKPLVGMQARPSYEDHRFTFAAFELGYRFSHPTRNRGNFQKSLLKTVLWGQTFSLCLLIRCNRFYQLFYRPKMCIEGSGCGPVTATCRVWRTRCAGWCIHWDIRVFSGVLREWSWGGLREGRIKNNWDVEVAISISYSRRKLQLERAFWQFLKVERGGRTWLPHGNLNAKTTTNTSRTRFKYNQMKSRNCDKICNFYNCELFIPIFYKSPLY